MQWIFSPLHSTYFNEVQWKKGYLNSIVSIKMNFIWRNWWKFNDWKYVCCSCSGWIKKGDEKKNWPIDTVSLISIKLSHLWPSFDFSIHQKFIQSFFLLFDLDWQICWRRCAKYQNKSICFFFKCKIFSAWSNGYVMSMISFSFVFIWNKVKTKRGKKWRFVFFFLFSKKWLEWEFWKKVLLRKAISYK